VAKLKAIDLKIYKRLGAREDPNFVLGEAFWEPLPEEELALWEGISPQDAEKLNPAADEHR
jgi:hypothetical protein